MSQTFAETPIDRVRDYWNRRPCNIRHSTKPVGTREYFDEVEARKYLVEPHIPAFAQFEQWRGKRVLEIGCGLGTDTMNFARAGAIVTAVDLSQESLDLAKQRARVLGLEGRIQFFQANAEELRKHIPEGQYDLVYSFGVIHHTPHPERVLEEVRQVLAPGGTLKLMMYHRTSYKVLWILLTQSGGKFWKVDEMIAKHSEAQTGCPVTYAYTGKSLAAFLGQHGLTTREMAVDHIFPYRIKDYVQYKYVRVWYFRWMPAGLFRWLERKWGWHLCATATKG
ncbi:MAG: class I SAM-dependent methyltransferase [Planctomycetota bacterium]|nr:class I SAM-dependent methyltransferase [Planctomycetota bacterium]